MTDPLKRPLPDNTQLLRETDIHAPGGIRTRNPSKGTAVNPRLTLRSHWGQQINLLKPSGHVMHQQFNIQQLYVLPTLYLCVLYLSENKQRLVPLTA